MNDPFEMLGVERRFDVDLSALEKTHRELSRAMHPDRYVQAGAGERRAALEKAASINEAWRTVRDPIRRAEALFGLYGVAVGDGNEPKAAPAFLMEVLEQREELAEARGKKDLAKVHAIGVAMAQRAVEIEAKLAIGFRVPGEPGRSVEALLPLLGELRFYRRFLEEVNAIEEEND